MRIAVDAMGGDHAPGEIVRGALQAARDFRVSVVLVGREYEVRRVLEEDSASDIEALVEVVPASEVIEMGEHPASAVRHKRDSSLVVAARLVKDGRCDAMVSAGNTGAAMAASLFAYGRIRGVDRPAIGGPMPTTQGHTLIVDAGANADVKARHLLQFAQMGSVYLSSTEGIAKPRVGLLNIGEEPNKGNELSLEAHALLALSGLNFIGNIEGRDVSRGKADVVVCDGFVGNVVLKFAEGVGSALFDIIRAEASRSLGSRVGALLMRPAFRSVKKVFDYSEYGGAPLLGLNGLTIISHGSSKAKAIRNAVRAAVRGAESGAILAMAESVTQMEEGKAVD